MTKHPQTNVCGCCIISYIEWNILAAAIVVFIEINEQARAGINNFPFKFRTKLSFLEMIQMTFQLIMRSRLHS
jgi:hypothetical protein